MGNQATARHPRAARVQGRTVLTAGGQIRVVGLEALPAGGDVFAACGQRTIAVVTDRPHVPADLKRRLMIEAGHRCAIPTCRAVAPLQIDHIDDWADVRRHDFENMIVLCSNCHGRKGNGHGHIDRKALRQYKANLAVVNSRYGDLERRVLEHLAEQRDVLRPSLDGRPGIADDWLRGLVIGLPSTMRLLMKYLVQDGYVEIVPGGLQLTDASTPTLRYLEIPIFPPGTIPSIDHYRLTPAGLEFLDAWMGAQPIDGLTEVEG